MLKQQQGDLLFHIFLLITANTTEMASHIAARSNPYKGGLIRCSVPDHVVSFDVAFPEYAPTAYTAHKPFQEDVGAVRYPYYNYQYYYNIYYS